MGWLGLGLYNIHLLCLFLPVCIVSSVIFCHVLYAYFVDNRVFYLQWIEYFSFFFLAAVVFFVEALRQVACSIMSLFKVGRCPLKISATPLVSRWRMLAAAPRPINSGALRCPTPERLAYRNGNNLFARFFFGVPVLWALLAWICLAFAPANSISKKGHYKTSSLNVTVNGGLVATEA